MTSAPSQGVAVNLPANPIGCHGLVWTDDYDTPEKFEEVARRTAAAGFTMVEVPLLDPIGFDAAHARQVLDDHGLTASLSVGHDSGTDVSGTAEQAARGEERLNTALRHADVLGAKHLVGVLFSELRRYPSAQTPAGRQQSQAVLGQVADRAADLGITLGLETVNRYETNMFNTIRDASRFAAEIGRSNIKVHIDSFHMNIEESDLHQPIIDHAEYIGYVHVSENTRGYLGAGGIDFDSFFRALVAIGYVGPITFETFSTSALSHEFAGLLAVWRDFYDDADALTAHAATFIRNKLTAAHNVQSLRESA